MTRTQTHVDEQMRAQSQAHGVQWRQLSRYLFVAPALIYITPWQL